MGESGPATYSIALDLHNSQVPCQTTSIPRFSKRSVTRSNGSKDATKHLKRCQTQDQPRTHRLQAHHASSRRSCCPLWPKEPSQVHIPVPRGAKPFSTLPCSFLCGVCGFTQAFKSLSQLGCGTRPVVSWGRGQDGCSGWPSLQRGRGKGWQSSVVGGRGWFEERPWGRMEHSRWAGAAGGDSVDRAGAFSTLLL